MSCSACTKRYGLFTKEFGCPNCGYSFCKNCLRKIIEVPRRNNEKLNVCLKCFEKLEQEQLFNKASVQHSTPSDLLALDMSSEPLLDLAPPLKPLETAEEAVPDDNDEINENLDSVISKRLKDLKDGKSMKLQSDTEMAIRLAGIKGQEYKEYSKADLLSKDTRTDQEKTNDLIKQFLEENIIDEAATAATDPLADIEKRLAALKGAAGPSNEAKKLDATTPEEKDEETAAKEIVEKFVAEAQLPDANLTAEEKEFLESIPPPGKDTEELPWCAICNEDAIIRCLGCDGDLYCRGCFKECHDDEDYRQHQTKPFEKPPNFKEDHF